APLTTGQQNPPGPTLPTTSSQFIAQSGMGVQQLVDAAFQRRSDLIAARQRLAIVQGNLIQAGLRPNPQLTNNYGSTRFLGGGSEYDLSAGISQLFETGGKRSKRVAVAQLALAQVRAEVLALERQTAADIRASYARALAAGRQLDTLERLIRAADEQVRITTVRLDAGDVAPLDLNLIRNETDRLRAQVIKTRADLQGELISLRALAGFGMAEPLRIAPLPDRPPRLDLSLADLTDMALRERPDLQAARIGEELGTARIRLAQSLATPNVSSSVTYSRTKRVTDLPESLGVGPVAQTENALVFGVAIDLPIFNKNQGQVASAVGEREQARAQREFLEATIKRDVALAYNRYRAAAETLVLYATQIVPRAEANLQSVRNAYSEGEFSIFDIVNEQRRLIDYQTSYNDALRDYYTALTDLERAIGTTIPTSGFAPGPMSLLPDDAPRLDPNNVRRALSSPSSLARQSAVSIPEAPTTTPSPSPSPTAPKP
ncbi:MAG TPA: TolC family protein, partial [Candidatus Eremiobacteraceae bacterium]|nr:TolC family protein [Candidatus Eremiobacteraceae bacterium]